MNPDEVVAQWACITAVKSYDPANTSFANVSVSLYTIQDYYYSIDNNCLNLLVKEGTSQNSTLTVPLEVAAENKNLFV